MSRRVRSLVRDRVMFWRGCRRLCCPALWTLCVHSKLLLSKAIDPHFSSSSNSSSSGDGGGIISPQNNMRINIFKLPFSLVMSAGQHFQYQIQCQCSLQQRLILKGSYECEIDWNLFTCCLFLPMNFFLDIILLAQQFRIGRAIWN